MLGRGDKHLPDDAVFGDFQIVKYADTAGRTDMTDFFLDFWRSKGGDKQTITRSHISPMEIKKFLEHVVPMDVNRENDNWNLVVRLIGSHVATYYGEITGQDIREMANSKAIERIYCVSRLVIESKEPAMTVSPAFSPDKEYMEAVALYLPLFDDKKEVVKIMVAVHVASPAVP